MGFHQRTRLIKSQQMTLNARYQAPDPWCGRTTPHMLCERERQTGGWTGGWIDRQTHIERDLDRQTD